MEAKLQMEKLSTADKVLTPSASLQSESGETGWNLHIARGCLFPSEKNSTSSMDFHVLMHQM